MIFLNKKRITIRAMAPVIASPQLSSLFPNIDPIRSKIINITCLIGFIQQTLTTGYAFDVFRVKACFCLLQFNAEVSLQKVIRSKHGFLWSMLRYKYTPYAMPYNGSSCNCHYTGIKWLPRNILYDTCKIIAYARASCAVYRQIKYRSPKKDGHQLSPVLWLSWAWSYQNIFS